MPVWRSVVTLQNPVLGGTGTNTWHARTTGGTDDNNQLDALTVHLSELYVALESIFTGGTQIDHNGEWVTVDGPGAQLLTTTPWQLASTGSDDSLPPACALVVSWRTALPTRRGRGRTFFGPITNSIAEGNGTPTEPARDQVHTAVDAFIAEFDDPLNGGFCIWSEADQVGRDIVSGRTQNQFGSLRSRRD